MAEKKFRFTAEETVSNTISKLRRESEELGRGLIRDARAYTTSGKETLAYIEQQIKAIERRNKADEKSQIISAKMQRDTGQISQKQFNERVKEIGIGSKTDEKQLLLLRELIETVKGESKREIIEDRKGVEKQIKSDKQIDKLSPMGDELHLLKRTLQRQELGDIKNQEREERDRFAGVRKAGEVVNRTGGMVAGSSNEFFMAASVMAAIPVIGDALSGLASRAFGAAQRMQTNRGRLYGVTGQRAEGAQFGALGLTGSTFAEFFDLQKQTAMAMGGGKGAGGAASNIMLLERLGIDRGMLLNQERMGRGGAAGSREAVQNLVKGLQAAGAINGQDFSKLSEYFDLSIQIQQEQLRTTGETNDNISNKLVAGIVSLDESFKNPDVLRGLMPTLTGGMVNPSSPQAEAFQFGLLRKMNPGASLTELQAMREKPTAELLKKSLAGIKRMSPNKDIQAQNLMGMFPGLSATMALKIANGEMNIEGAMGQQGITGLQKRVGRTTGTLEGASANWDRKFETYGDDLTKLVKDLVGKESGLGKFAEEFGESVKKYTDATDNWVKSKWWVPNIISPKVQAGILGRVYKAITE